MLQDFFISAFEFLHGNQNSLFREKVYQPAGISLLFIALGVVLLFYYGINFFRARFARRSYWLIAAGSCALLSVVAAMAAVHATEGLAMFEAAAASFYLIDALYGLLLFFLLSLLLKWGSRNARRTPF